MSKIFKSLVLFDQQVVKDTIFGEKKTFFSSTTFASSKSEWLIYC